MIDDLRNPPVMSEYGSHKAVYSEMSVRMFAAADEIERLKSTIRLAIHEIENRGATYALMILNGEIPTDIKEDL